MFASGTIYLGSPTLRMGHNLCIGLWLIDSPRDAVEPDKTMSTSQLFDMTAKMRDAYLTDARIHG